MCALCPHCLQYQGHQTFEERVGVELVERKSHARDICLDAGKRQRSFPRGEIQNVGVVAAVDLIIVNKSCDML